MGKDSPPDYKAYEDYYPSEPYKQRFTDSFHLLDIPGWSDLTRPFNFPTSNRFISFPYGAYGTGTRRFGGRVCMELQKDFYKCAELVGSKRAHYACREVLEDLHECRHGFVRNNRMKAMNFERQRKGMLPLAPIAPEAFRHPKDEVTGGSG